MVTQVRTTQFYDGTTDHIFEMTHDAVPEVGEGQIHIKMSHISIDPAMRGWASNKRSYIEPVQPGEIMRCFGVAEVVESKSPKFAKGDWVTGFLGAQTEGVISTKGFVRKIDTRYAEPKDYLGGLGMTGYTAYFGIKDIAKPKPGQTVVVSAASGAVGSIAAQIAKLQGARVVGIAGGDDKCAYLRDVLKLDAVVDYKGCDSIAKALKEACPDGIDVYFDNVGGETLDAVFTMANHKATIVVCGGISQYGAGNDVKGPKNYLSIISHSIKMQGFTMADYAHRIDEAFMYLATAKKEGSIIMREHLLEGISSFQEAFEMIYAGKNHGKLLIKVD